MSLRFRLPVIIVALVLLLLAGCKRNHCRLRADHEMLQASTDSIFGPHPNSRYIQPTNPTEPSLPVFGEISGHDPARFRGAVARRLPPPTSIAQHNALPQAGIASDGPPQRGEPAQPSHFRPASFHQAEELPAPPAEGGSGEKKEELPPPYSSETEGELIVVPIPRRPPGCLKRLLKFVGCAHLAGCAHHETAKPLSIKTPPFSPSGEVYVPDRWWRSFGDAALNHQIEYSLGGSFTLAAALQRLRAAQALARREASDLWPDFNGVADAEGTLRTFAPNDSRFALGLDASYQVDLWGEIGSRVEAERLRASATEADYHAVALTLSAEIARTWFALIEAHAQLELLDEQLETNLTGLKLQETRFGGGGEGVGSADVLRQRQLVESTREQIVIARAGVDVLEHRLAVLQGRPPQRATYYVGSDLPTVPPLPVTGLPSELLQRRPDVRRDYLALLAADRDLASAISAQYPRLNLAGALTTLADNPANLFHDWIFAIAGQVISPLIDGGQRRAEVDRNAAVLHQLVADYGQTVLIAFSEVEDALALERYQRQRIDSLNKQYELARQASEQLRDRYFRFGEEIGETEYLDVLTATITEQQLQRDMVSARLDLILTRIALYLALAGSFDPHPQVIVDDRPPRRVIHERPSETTNITPLDSDRDFIDRLPVYSCRGSSRDCGDQPDRADRTTDRGDPQVGGAR
jgi:NodT family efflux transporter outer membrane factor (OMF) lipoprotein